MEGRESAIEGALLEERGGRMVLVEREGSKRVAIACLILINMPRSTRKGRYCGIFCFETLVLG